MARFAPSASQDGVADAIALARPRVCLGVGAEPRRQLHSTIECGPAQHLGRQVVAMLPAHLPHPGIRILPPRSRGVGDVCDESLYLRLQRTELLLIAME